MDASSTRLEAAAAAAQFRCIRFDTEDRTLREVASESLLWRRMITTMRGVSFTASESIC